MDMKVDMEVDPVLEGLTEQQLKDIVFRNSKEMIRLREDAKAYAKGARDAIKNLEQRNEEVYAVMDSLSRKVNG